MDADVKEHPTLREELASPWVRTWEGWEGGTRRGGGLVSQLRRSVVRWPVVVLLAFVIAIAVATDITSPASMSGRLSVLQSYYASEQVGISSCSGGLRDSITAMTAILTGTSRDRRTAESIAIAGEQACSPTADGDLYDMATAVPPRLLTGFHMSSANVQLYSWADPGALLAQQNIDRLLVNHQVAGSPAARALYKEIVALAADGARVQGLFNAAATRLQGELQPLYPPITPPGPAVLQ